MVEPRTEADNIRANTPQLARQSENFRGEEISQRQSYLQTLTEPRPHATPPEEQHILGYVEDTDSQAPGNTPLKTKENFNAVSVEATLDTGASLSVVRAVLVRFVVNNV